MYKNSTKINFAYEPIVLPQCKASCKYCQLQSTDYMPSDLHLPSKTPEQDNVEPDLLY